LESPVRPLEAPPFKVGQETRLRVNLEPLGYTRGLKPFDKLTALSWSRGLSKGKLRPLGPRVERSLADVFEEGDQFTEILVAERLEL
jgi:hypothetical protein